MIQEDGDFDWFHEQLILLVDGLPDHEVTVFNPRYYFDPDGDAEDESDAIGRFIQHLLDNKAIHPVSDTEYSIRWEDYEPVWDRWHNKMKERLDAGETSLPLKQQVLVANDSYGHCHVFRIDTPEQREQVFLALSKPQISDRCTLSLIQAAARDGDYSAIEDIFSDHDLPLFDRRGGGRMYIVEVADKVPDREYGFWE